VWACAHPPSRAIERIAAEQEVRTAEQQRFGAMMNQNVAALDTLLDDDLTYVKFSDPFYRGVRPSPGPLASDCVGGDEGLALIVNPSRP
jgi:hypothetical protein